jgi:hypothetical protein
MSESQILNANPGCKNLGHPIYIIDIGCIFPRVRVGTKFESLMLTPSTPSFESQSSEFYDRPTGASPERAPMPAKGHF